MRIRKIELSSGLLILLTAIFIAFFSNNIFWSLLFQRLDIFSWQGSGYLLAFLSLMVAILFLILTVFAHKNFLKPVLVFFIIVSAVMSYFTDELKILFSEDMIMNIAETIRDNNRHEGMELLSLPLFIHVFLFGVIPSMAIMLVNNTSTTWRREINSKLVYILGVVLVSGALVLVNFKYMAYFSRENKDLRVHVMPIFAFFSLQRFVAHDIEASQFTFTELGKDAVQKKSYRHKTVGIMVVGETARADHFSLNGYAVETNPLLKQQDIVNFSNTHSCGTSTAFSVPCMFSFIGQNGFSPNEALKYSNVLDVLKTAGVTVLWKDNNSSCKNVCNRIENVNLKHNPDTHSPFYHEGEYYDEVLLDGLNEYIDQSDKDVLIVFHVMGSHGPSYYKRYPENFGLFSPLCDKNSPQECNTQEIVNAYDNTILYTDYFLNKTISFLQSNTDKYESFMMYVSDHGESLGENGIYLHGLPYMIAPESQTHVPFIVWQSDQFMANNNTSLNKLGELSGNAYSHDNITHSLLGFFKVETGLYKSELDIFKPDINAHLIAAVNHAVPVN